MDAADVTVPPTVAVTVARLTDFQHVAGEELSLTTAVDSVGDTPAEGVAIVLDTPDAVETDTDKKVIGTIESRDRATAEFTVTPTEAGEYTFEVTATTAGNEDADGKANAVQMTAVGNESLCGGIGELLAQLQTRIAESELQKGQQQSSLAKVDTEIQKAINQFNAASKVLQLHNYTGVRPANQSPIYTTPTPPIITVPETTAMANVRSWSEPAVSVVRCACRYCQRATARPPWPTTTNPTPKPISGM